MALDKDVLDRLNVNAQLVYDETKASANTHTRVGQAFLDTHELFTEVENDESDIAQLQKDMATAQTDISNLTTLEANDIKAVNDAIDALSADVSAITPRKILPLERIVTSQVSIHAAGITQAGRAVWCSVNGVFAWALGSGSIMTDFYGSWGAYGIYPLANLYLEELTSGANAEVWYYVETEGAFYYWNGSQMEKITSINFATQEALTQGLNEAEQEIAKKQDILEAGHGILIESNVISAQIDYDENVAAYGIRRNINDSSPDCERIGNMDLHRTLPVQSLVRGCLLDDDGNVVEYLPDSDWTGATLDGSKGQVMVEFPQHYRKCQLLDDGTMEVWLSLYYLPGYESIPKMYVSAYEATVQRSTNKLSSVMSDDPDYRGGDNDASADDFYYSQLGKPATSITMPDSLTYARNRGTAGLNGCGWNSYLYEAHKAMTWFFVVEYATLNTLKAYNSELTSEGYHQGGLGAGITNLNSNRWPNWLNGQSDSVIKCGITNSFGNHTGVLAYTMPFEYDGCSSTSGDTGTRYVGVYDETAEYVSGDYVSDGDLLYQCILDAPAGTPLTDTTYFTSVSRTTTNIPRYRGVEDPFGNINKIFCDILCMAHASEESGGEGDGLNYFYTCKDPSKFGLSTSDINNYSFIGTAEGTASGQRTLYFTQIIFGSSGEIIGKDSGGSSSTYYCDGLVVNNKVTSDALRGVRVGGSAAVGSAAGLFYAAVTAAPSSSHAARGSRLCFIPA